MHSVHGAPCPPVTFSSHGKKKYANSSTATGRQGGVAIFSHSPWVTLPRVCTPEITHLYKQGRWTHAAIPLGPTGAAKKRFLHIISFYNISGRDQGVLRTNRNRFLECIFTHAAGLGQQPVMICTDANTSVSSSHCLSLAVATGQWIDLGSHFTNNSPEPTFGPFKTWDKYSWTKNVSRPDYILVNQAALSICRSFKLRRDLSPRGHLGLEVVIQTNCLCQVYRTINVPKAFPQTLRLTQEEQDKLVDAIPSKKYADFQAAKNSDPNLAWKIFASIAEDYLRAAHRAAGVQGEGGRHSAIRFKQMNTTQSVASKQHPTEVSTATLNSLLRMNNLGRCSQQDANDSEVLSRKLFHFANKAGLRMSSNSQLNLVDLNSIDNLLDGKISDTQELQLKTRLNKWKWSLRIDFRKGGRKAFSWLKDDWSPPLTAVQSTSGQTEVTPAKVVDCLQNSWNKLFNQQSQPEWEPFLNKFREFLVPYPCILQDITAQNLHDFIHQMSNHRAAAVCGWRVHEMKQLPIRLLEMPAELYKNIEHGQEWPAVNSFACISCLPKTELDVTNIKLKSGVYAPDAFDTRPISNISPWTTVYSGIRFKQMANWREQWLPQSMHGARAKHETSDASYERSKFFDLFPHELCFQILKALGAPEPVLIAERTFYSQFQCLYKANGAISSHPSGRTNGFIQGCSFSLQASLGILSVYGLSLSSHAHHLALLFLQEAFWMTTISELFRNHRRMQLICWNLHGRNPCCSISSLGSK